MNLLTTVAQISEYFDDYRNRINWRIDCQNGCTIKLAEDPHLHVGDTITLRLEVIRGPDDPPEAV